MLPWKFNIFFNHVTFPFQNVEKNQSYTNHRCDCRMTTRRGVMLRRVQFLLNRDYHFLFLNRQPFYQDMPLSTHLASDILCLVYFAKCWKLSPITMMPEESKDLTLGTLYELISLLPSLTNLFENLLLSKLQQSLDENKVIISYQFGFRIKQKLNSRKYSSAVLFDNT